MSKIALSPNASGTALFTIASPATNTDRTLTLPDEAGTVLTSASTANFPAGSVLQVAKGESTTEVSFSTIQTYTVLYSFNITAIGNNSRYIFDTYQHCYHNSSTSSARANLGYSVTIGGTTTRLAGVDGSSGDSWGTKSYPGGLIARLHVWDSSVSTGTTITVNVLGAAFDAGTVYFNYSGYSWKGFCTVTEVAV